MDKFTSRLVRKGNDLVIKITNESEPSLLLDYASAVELYRNSVYPDGVITPSQLNDIKNHRAKIGQLLLTSDARYQSLPIPRTRSSLSTQVFLNQGNRESENSKALVFELITELDTHIWLLRFEFTSATLGEAKWDDRKGIVALVERFYDYANSEIALALLAPEEVQKIDEQIKAVATLLRNLTKDTKAIDSNVSIAKSLLSKYSPRVS